MAPALAVWVAPAASGQAPAKAVRIGLLGGGGSPKAADSRLWPVFFEAMRQRGYVEGGNVTYIIRYADGVPAQLPQLAAELVGAGVELIVVTGSSEAVAASRATSSLPIVTIQVGDPVGLGLAASLARPGRNVTGSTLYIPGFAAKALELLIEAVPGARRIALLGNPTQPNLADDRRALEQMAQAKGVTLLPTYGARRPDELEPALAQMARDKPQALVVLSHALFIIARQRIIDFAAAHRLPTMHGYAEDVAAGGLMTYAVDTRTLYARAPHFVDQILKGAKPGEIPIEQPTRFGLWLNLKTARALGIKFPTAVLLRAEQIIE